MVFAALKRRFAATAREAFWHIGPTSLVVAVMEARSDEPLLVAAAGLRTNAGRALGAPVAPGVLETARAVDATRLGHVVALDAGYFEVAADTGADRCGGDGGRVVVEIRGLDREMRVGVDRDVLTTVAAIFGAAGLELRAIDCEPAALHNLRRFAGGDSGGDDAFAEAVAADPLAAVSVATQAECGAVALGRALAVPVGLALGRYGFVDG